MPHIEQAQNQAPQRLHNLPRGRQGRPPPVPDGLSENAYTEDAVSFSVFFRDILRHRLFIRYRDGEGRALAKLTFHPNMST